MTKRSYHHGDLRAALLDVAIEAIAEQGVAHLSLRDCARRIGVSHAAPYRHFATKEALLLALAEQGFRWLVDEARAAMAACEQPAERLDAYGVAYVRFAVDHPEHHRIMFTSELSPEVDVDGPSAADEAFALLVEQAAAVSESEDPEAAAFAYWSLVHGMSMLIIDGRVPAERLASRGAVEELARTAFRIWRSGAV
ncbi:MAG: TetR/AcrR family transcriptional regulator [Deltaproteobacteria bacterium]|nr:MAG: TetR/AcrR family transcriptional regulator [Deltaproteobacteria bacterium]